MTLRFGYADTAHGQVHYAETGSGPPVLCLHQTPRSLDEYREILPVLGERHRAIAMDTPGMGSSPAPAGEASIEAYADAALGLADALGLARFVVVGHHTGGVIAVRLAAIAGSRVRAVVLSSTPFVDAAGRAARADRPPIDAVERADDGAHLDALWHRRAAFYPGGRADITGRYVLDALRARDPEEGHEAVARYRMEDDIGAVTQPCLVVGHRRDPYAWPETDAIVGQLPGARVVEMPDGMVPLEVSAAPFAAAVNDFLATLG